MVYVYLIYIFMLKLLDKSIIGLQHINNAGLDDCSMFISRHCRGIYFAKYYGGGGEMAAGKKMKTEGVGKK